MVSLCLGMVASKFATSLEMTHCKRAQNALLLQHRINEQRVFPEYAGRLNRTNKFTGAHSFPQLMDNLRGAAACL